MTARREQILRVAHEVFAHRGFRGATLRDIAERCGISQAGLLHHFKSKVDILGAVLEARHDSDVARYQSARASGVQGLPALRETIAVNLTVPGAVRLFTTLSAEACDPAHPAHEFFRRRYARSRDMFEDLLIEARDDGLVAPDVDTRSAAAVLIAVLDGLQLQWLLDPAFDLPAGLDAHLAGLAGARPGTAPADAPH